MDRDVESRLRKLCDKYAVAASGIEQVRPSKIPDNRARRRAERKVSDLLVRLRDDRGAPCLAMIKLAYVRAMRANDPQARLGPEQQTEVKFLASILYDQLAELDRQVVRQFRRHLSHLVTGRVLRNTGAGDHIAAMVERAGAPVPMEQRARACATSILERAEMAGGLAGVSSGDYDGVPNVP